eukprot:scaffold88881_cov49-Attheya_sp.AAC.7
MPDDANKAFIILRSVCVSGHQLSGTQFSTSQLQRNSLSLNVKQCLGYDAKVTVRTNQARARRS